MKRCISCLSTIAATVSLFAADPGGTTPIVLSSKMRGNDPTVMDVTYIVHSMSNTVNVRALAFEDGERSFWKVVRPETFVKDLDGNETAQNIGDNIAANVEHKLAWKVDNDWGTDLAKVKFEILTSDMAQLPLKTMMIPATAKNPFSLKVAYNEQNDTDIFNALLWWYADGDPNLVNENGYVDVDGLRWIERNAINGNARMPILTWLYDKMGWEPLMGGNLMSYIRCATRKDLWWNMHVQNCAILQKKKPNSLYVGENAYMVIDLSGGTNAENYPISYLDSEPVNGWSDDYKTTKIVLRRIEAGKYLMQDKKEVTLTKPFYMGVFEVTQKQYELVMGTNPSQYKGDMRPVERISWNMIRGDSSICDWPTAKTVDNASFVGRLRSKTGNSFDLPTEAQWECACRAGTTSHYNNGSDGIEGLNLDLRALGRYSGNKDDGRGSFSKHTIVGSYVPNFWGLYDTHGNIAEWCLDWYGDLNTDPIIDATTRLEGSERVVRGGCWNWCGWADDASYRLDGGACRSGSRCGRVPITATNEIGFRLCLTME